MAEIIQLYEKKDMSSEATKLFDFLFEETDVFAQLRLTPQQVLLLQRVCWKIYENQHLNANAQELVQMKIWRGVKKSTASDTLTRLVDLQLLYGEISNKRTKARRISVNLQTMRKLRERKSRDQTAKELLSIAESRKLERAKSMPSKLKNYRQNKTTKQKSGVERGARSESAAVIGADATHRIRRQSLESKFQDPVLVETVLEAWADLDLVRFIAFLDETFDEALETHHLTSIAMVFDRYPGALEKTVEKVKQELISCAGSGVGS